MTLVGGESGVIVVGAGGLGREIRDSVEAQHALGGMPFWGYFGLSPNTGLGDNASGAVFTRNVIYYSGREANIWLERRADLA